MDSSLQIIQSPNYILEFTYLIASILFIFGLKGLSHPDTARRGMFLAEAGMAAAIIGTLFHRDVHFFGWIIAGLILGSMVGAAFAIWVPMTAMPQRTALSHAFGAIAAALVGIAEFTMHHESMSTFTLCAVGLEVMLGTLTTTGSLIACGKLQGVIRGTPVQFKGSSFSTPSSCSPCSPATDTPSTIPRRPATSTRCACLASSSASTW